MNIWEIFKTKEPQQELEPAPTQDGSYPVYMQYNQLSSIWQCDLAWQCVDRIIDEAVKHHPRHVIQTDNSLVSCNDSLQRVLDDFNPMMTMHDAMSKALYMVLTRYNCYIYPIKKKYFYGGEMQNSVESLHILNPSDVKFLRDKTDTLYSRFEFSNGYTVTVPYSDIIHIRDRYEAKEFEGGRSNAGLMRNIQLNENLLQSLQKSTDAALRVNAIVQYGGVLSKETLAGEVKDFENKLRNNESGILGLNHNDKYQEMKRDPKLIDKDTLEFLQTLVTNSLGVSLPILNGTATKEEKDSWRQSRIVPLLQAFEQAFTKCLFTPRQRALGHRIRFYNSNRLQFMGDAELNNAAAFLTNIGALTLNQALGLYDLPPIGPEGDKRVQSLNYVDTEIAKQYQMGMQKEEVQDE